MNNDVALVWIRRDLRLQDHLALHAALTRHQQVVLAFVHAPAEEAPWAPGAASCWWLHHSLKSFMDNLQALGQHLILRQGDSAKQLLDLAQHLGASHVYAHHLYEPALRAQEEHVKSALSAAGIALHLFNGAFLTDPNLTAPTTKKGYQVFTPFWRHIQTLPQPALPLPAPASWSEPSALPHSVVLDDLKLLPDHPWHLKLHQHWTPGETQALDDLDTFLEANLNAYATQRDVPATTGTSLLSSALHFGELSPRQVWHAAIAYQSNPNNKVSSTGLDAFLRQLGWREFATHVLHHHPHTANQPLQSSFASFPWLNDPTYIEAWKKGQTGFPLVDAGMKQLWATGWMHNRVRMVVSGVFSKQLGGDWRIGARWFWDTLVDADLANNTMGWQWSAGCGADAAPYFRILNPHRQAERFDPQGAYVKKWCPALSGLAGKDILNPPPLPSYPAPLVDLAAARLQALGRGK